MSLADTIKELKNQIEEEEKKVPEEEAEAVVEEEKEEEKPEEEEKKEEEKDEKEEKPEEKEESPDASAYQRMRREAAAAKKKAEEAEAKREKLEQELERLKAGEMAEEKPDLVPEMEEIVKSHRMTRAEREFQSLEANFRRSTPEYDAVAAEYTMALAQSIKIQNPRMSNEVIAEKTKEAILVKAAQFMNAGYDPIEELYHEAKELGFTGKSMRKEAEETEEKEIRPDMKKLAANRAKSTGMAAAGGKSVGNLTKQAAAELSAAEWMKLPAEEKKRLMYG